MGGFAAARLVSRAASGFSRKKAIVVVW